MPDDKNWTKTELELDLIRSTDSAYLLSDGDGHNHWVGKSVASSIGGGVWLIPEWIAVENGWV